MILIFNKKYTSEEGYGKIKAVMENEVSIYKRAKSRNRKGAEKEQGEANRKAAVCANAAGRGETLEEIAKRTGYW